MYYYNILVFVFLEFVDIIKTILFIYNKLFFSGMWGGTSPGGISSSSSASWRSGSPSPSPPLSESDAIASSAGSWGMRTSPPPIPQSTPTSDEGIGLDEDELPRKKKVGARI